jgi:hypothetical protein
VSIDIGLGLTLTSNLGAGARPAWLVPGPDGALPVQVSAWADNAGYFGGEVHASATAYLAAAGGTFSRASDAWRRDADRIWRKSGSNQPRLHHDATGKPLGLLVEGQRTFSLPYSRDFTNANWTKRGTCTVTQDLAVARPDGTLGAMRIENMGGFNNDIYAAGIGGGSQNSAPQLMIRRLSTTGILTAQKVNVNQTGIWRIDLALLSGEWEHITRNHPAVTVVEEFVTSPAGNLGINIFAFSGGSLAFYADFVNIELGGVFWSSSPMDPSTGAVARLADALSYSAATPAETTIVVDAVTAPGLNAAQALFHWDDGTVNNRLRLYRDAGTGQLVLLVVKAGAPAWYSLIDGAVGDNTRIKAVIALKAGSIAGSVNGVSAKTWSIASPIPTGLSTFREGCGVAGEHWFGTVARTDIYAKAYAPADLPGMSAP